MGQSPTPALVANSATFLKLTGIGVMPYSARGITQTLQPIQQQGVVKRTVNGRLRNLSLDQFKKYASTISCNDQLPPVCDGVWIGREVTVDCVSMLTRITGTPPAREVVPGSEFEEGPFTIYRPRLLMMVVPGGSLSEDEYGRATSWSLNLEEI